MAKNTFCRLPYLSCVGDGEDDESGGDGKSYGTSGGVGDDVRDGIGEHSAASSSLNDKTKKEIINIRSCQK